MRSDVGFGSPIDCGLFLADLVIYKRNSKAKVP